MLLCDLCQLSQFMPKISSYQNYLNIFIPKPFCPHSCIYHCVVTLFWLCISSPVYFVIAIAITITSCPTPFPRRNRKRTSLTPGTKLDKLQCIESDKGSSILRQAFNLGKSAVHNIRKNANKTHSAFCFFVCHNNHIH